MVKLLLMMLLMMLLCVHAVVCAARMVLSGHTAEGSGVSEFPAEQRSLSPCCFVAVACGWVGLVLRCSLLQADASDDGSGPLLHCLHRQPVNGVSESQVQHIACRQHDGVRGSEQREGNIACSWGGGLRCVALPHATL